MRQQQKLLIVSAECTGILHVANIFMISNIVSRSLLDTRQVFLSSTHPLLPEVEQLKLDAFPKKLVSKNSKLVDMTESDLTPRFKELRRLVILRSNIAGMIYQTACSLTYSSISSVPDTSSLLNQYTNDPSSMVMREYAEVRNLPVEECVAELKLHLESEAITKARTLAFVHKYTDVLRTVFTKEDQQRVKDQITSEVSIFL